MKKTAILFTSFLSLPCFASTKAFDVKAEVSIDGKLISKPHIVTKPNELASINQKIDGNKAIWIEMIASDYVSKDTKDGIMMKFTLSREEAGKRTVISTPQIVALPGETAEIAVGEKANVDAVKINVIATRAQ